MAKFDFARTLAAIVCTALFSSVAIFGAVAPAQADATHAIAPVTIAAPVA